MKREEWKPPEGFARTLTVALDTAQYQLDMNHMVKHKSEDVYSSFNLLMRWGGGHATVDTQARSSVTLAHVCMHAHSEAHACMHTHFITVPPPFLLGIGITGLGFRAWHAPQPPPCRPGILG